MCLVGSGPWAWALPCPCRLGRAVSCWGAGLLQHRPQDQVKMIIGAPIPHSIPLPPLCLDTHGEGPCLFPGSSFSMQGGLRWPEGGGSPLAPCPVSCIHSLPHLSKASHTTGNLQLNFCTEEAPWSSPRTHACTHTYSQQQAQGKQVGFGVLSSSKALQWQRWR